MVANRKERSTLLTGVQKDSEERATPGSKEPKNA